MKRFLMLAMALVLTVVLAACGSNNDKGNNDDGAEKVTIKHQLGETPVKKNPENIIVFDFGVLDTLDKLGIEIKSLPQGNVPTYLEKYNDEKYVNAGSLKEPDFDKISELNADLIIIADRQAEMYDEFSKLGPTIHMQVDNENYLESFEHNLNIIGEIFGKDAEIKSELEKIHAEISNLQEVAKDKDGKGLIILANDGKISAYGANSRFGIIHDVFNIAQADENIEVSTHGQPISFEYILEKNPDYLFVIDRGAVVGGESSAKQVIENDIVKNTKAYEDGKIVYLDPNYWYLSGGGLVSVSEMVKEIENGIK